MKNKGRLVLIDRSKAYLKAYRDAVLKNHKTRIWTHKGTTEYALFDYGEIQNDNVA